MRLDPTGSSTQEIESESDFYQRVRKRCLGVIGFERVEPSNESGFPDTYFVLKSPKCKRREGTVEFKFWHGKGAPDISGDITRGTQKTGLIEYAAMGGNRRFFLVYTKSGEVWLYNTADAVHSVVKKENRVSSMANLEEPAFVHWLMSNLEK